MDGIEITAINAHGTISINSAVLTAGKNVMPKVTIIYSNISTLNRAGKILVRTTTKCICCNCATIKHNFYISRGGNIATTVETSSAYCSTRHRDIDITNIAGIAAAVEVIDATTAKSDSNVTDHIISVATAINIVQRTGSNSNICISVYNCTVTAAVNTTGSSSIRIRHGCASCDITFVSAAKDMATNGTVLDSYLRVTVNSTIVTAAKHTAFHNSAGTGDSHVGRSNR